ncbi:MAG: type II toxin-antitoxin system YafQ family toxin [Phormidesmis sp.]
MLEVKYTKQFRKDSKKAKKQRKDLPKLKAVIRLLQEQKELPSSLVDHSLTGQPYLNCRDCHIEPDWVLIYKVVNGDLVLVRIGSHSELFK